MNIENSTVNDNWEKNEANSSCHEVLKHIKLNIDGDNEGERESDRGGERGQQSEVRM